MGRPYRPSVPEHMHVYMLGGLIVGLLGASAGLLFADTRLAALVALPLLVLLLLIGSRLRSTRAELQRVKGSLNGVSKGILITDNLKPGHPVVSVNSALTRMTRYDSKSILGRTSRILEGPDTDLEAKKDIDAALRDGRPYRKTLKLYRRDGKAFWSELTISPVRDESGKPTLSVWELSDVSRDHQTEENVRSVEARLAAITDQATDALVFVSEQGTVESFNPSAERLFGYTRDEILGQHVRLLVPPTERPTLDQILERGCEPAQEAVVGTSREMTGQRKDGTALPLHVTAHGLKAGTERKAVLVLRDLTERRRVEQQQAALSAATLVLAESSTVEVAGKKLLQVVCEHLRWEMGILWVVDTVPDVLRCSAIWRAPRSFLGRVSMIALGQTCRLGEGLAGRAWQTMEPEWTQATSETPEPSESPSGRNGRKAGALALPVVTGKQLLAVLEFHGPDLKTPDPSAMTPLAAITGQFGQILTRLKAEGQLKQMEAQLRQSQKGEIITSLAGGIAHDLNNSLTAILGFTELAFPALPPESRARAHLKQILKAGHRSSARQE